MRRAVAPRAHRRASRINPLDQALRRFEHRWQTDRQFRSMASGVLALVMLVLVCVSLGVVTTVANTALAGMLRPATANNQGPVSVDTGTGQVKLIPTYPTLTAPPSQQTGDPPANQIPNSQTPIPNVTPTIAPEPTATSDGSGNGGGGNYACTGGNGAINWAFSPCPQVNKLPGMFTVTARNWAGAALNVVITFSDKDSCALLFTPESGNKLDGAGNAVMSYTVPACAANSQVPIGGMINISGGPGITFTAKPAV